MQVKAKRKNLVSLTQDEVLGIDDEFVNINVTKCKKSFYFLIASFGYILNGFFVGWSSKYFSFDEMPSLSNTNVNLLNRSQISWIISGFPLGVVIVSFVLYHFYYWIGTKLSLLFASFLTLLSFLLTMPFGDDFEILIGARVIGGLGGGIIFILVPIYMKELLGPQYNGHIVDLLITQFGIGIFLQYFIDFVTTVEVVSVLSICLSFFYFIICCLIPESPRYQAHCDMRRSYDLEKAGELPNLWSEEDLQRKSIVDLFVELKKLNLLSLIGLILVEQFIGGISILFYMKHFAQLTGGHFSPEMIAVIVGLVLIFSIPIAKLIKFSTIQSTKKQIIISTIAVLVCMIILSVFCITEGSLGRKLNYLRFLPMLLFATVTFFYVVGISRNSLLIMQQILTSYSLQLHLRTLSIFVMWFFIFAITKLLPQLLYLVGVGYFYFYMTIFTLVALVFIHYIVPSTLNLEVDKATPNLMERSFTTSTTSSETPSSPLSQSSSCCELHRIEHI